jgi:hypothetical protein
MLLCVKTVPKVVLKFEWELLSFYLSAEKLCSLRRKSQTRKSQIRKFVNRKEYMVRISQIRKLPHLEKVCKSKKKIKSANLQICDLRNLISNRPPLPAKFIYNIWKT